MGGRLPRHNGRAPASTPSTKPRVKPSLAGCPVDKELEVVASVVLAVVVVVVLVAVAITQSCLRRAKRSVPEDGRGWSFCSAGGSAGVFAVVGVRGISSKWTGGKNAV